MQEAKAILVLAAAVLVPLGISLVVAAGAGHVAGWIAARFTWTRRLAKPIDAAVSTVVLLVLALGFIVAYGAVTNSSASSKAAMLARGIREALTCTPILLAALAVVLGFGSLLLLVWRRRRRASAQSGSPGGLP
jgi:hypothetical protein